MGLDKRVERNASSVYALRDYLLSIARNPAGFITDTSLIQSLKSQGALAKLCHDDRGIHASSLNTIKRIANDHLDGGFEALDLLRRRAIDAITKEQSKATRPDRSSKLGLRTLIQELESERALLREDLLQLSRVFFKSLTQGRQYAASSGRQATVDLCKREQRELLTELTLLKTELPSNVVSITRG